MSRRARESGEFLHIIVRGIGKQILFEDDIDRRKYLGMLEKYSTENKISLLAYCLMENHIHLLLRDSEDNISVFMKQMGVSYAQYYNRKYERVGHLFQDRYKSEVVDEEDYLLTAFRYILNNPVKAGMCSADEYVWSSYQEYGKQSALTDTELFCELIGDKQALNLFLAEESTLPFMESEEIKHDDAWALEAVKRILQVESGTQLQKFERKKRNEALRMLKKHGLTVRQIERLTGINRGIVQRA